MNPTTRREPNAVQPSAVVACSDHRASQAGASVLREGGTAVDAAVVAALVLYVIEPHSCGPGGDGFLIHTAPGGRVEALDGAGAVPVGLTQEALGEAGLVPGRGPLSVTVPGALGQLEEALSRYGSRSLREAVEPALSFATEGFEVSATLARAVGGAAPQLAEDPVLGELYVPGGRPVHQGEKISNPAMATCLQALAEEGSRVLYDGWLAESISSCVESAGGRLSLQDLRNHQTREIAPESTTFRGTQVWELPSPTQGPAVLRALEALEETGPHPDWSVVVDAVDAGMRGGGFDVSAIGASGSSPSPQRRSPTRGDTTYIAAIDDQGRTASLITSVFGDFGAQLGIPELGGPIHNRAAMYRVTQTPPSPGHKPPHTTIPAVVTRDREPLYALGVAGGFMQPQAQVQILVRMLDEGRTPQEAIDAPRFKILFGGDLALEAGHPLAAVHPDAAQRSPGQEGFGGAQLASRDAGALAAGADPRRDGAVAFA